MAKDINLNDPSDLIDLVFKPNQQAVEALIAKTKVDKLIGLPELQERVRTADLRYQWAVESALQASDDDAIDEAVSESYWGTIPLYVAHETQEALDLARELDLEIDAQDPSDVRAEVQEELERRIEENEAKIRRILS